MADTSLPLKKEEHPYAKLLADPIRYSSRSGLTGESPANVQARMTFPSLTDMFKITPVDDSFGPWKHHAQWTTWYFGCFVCLHNQQGKKKKSEKLLVLQRASSISSRAGGQLIRFLNLKGETIMPKRNENFHKAIALIPSALHPSFISHCTPGEHVLKDYNINMVSKILESFSWMPENTQRSGTLKHENTNIQELSYVSACKLFQSTFSRQKIQAQSWTTVCLLPGSCDKAVSAEPGIFLFTSLKLNTEAEVVPWLDWHKCPNISDNHSSQELEK